MNVGQIFMIVVLVAMVFGIISANVKKKKPENTEETVETKEE